MKNPKIEKKKRKKEKEKKRGPCEKSSYAAAFLKPHSRSLFFFASRRCRSPKQVKPLSRSLFFFASRRRRSPKQVSVHHLLKTSLSSVWLLKNGGKLVWWCTTVPYWNCYIRFSKRTGNSAWSGSVISQDLVLLIFRLLFMENNWKYLVFGFSFFLFSSSLSVDKPGSWENAGK